MSSGPLNLSGADLEGFKPLDANRYNAEVFEMSMDAVKNADGQGKLPAGTPMIKVQFKLTDEGVENRRVFSQYVLPPDGYDEKKAATMKGIVANFFIALGVPEADVLSKKFAPDFEDFIGRACVVVVGKVPKKTRDGSVVEGEWNNPVNGVKPAGSIATSGAASSGLL